jgi:hypothetical protein
MSILVSIETDLAKVAHAFVRGAHALKSALVWAAKEEEKIAPEVAAIENVANTVVGAIYPGADKVALAIEAVFAKALTAVEDLGSAAAADGLNIQLDTAAVQAVKDALPIVKAQSKTTPGS